MVIVDPAEVSIALYITVLSGAVIAIVLKNANSVRVELKQDIAGVRAEMATKRDLAKLESRTMATKQDLADFQMATRQDLARLESRMATKQDLAELRSEMMIMRSDLTQVALAVGARPQASTE